jgi:Domain of unknown function (DUF5666)
MHRSPLTLFALLLLIATPLCAQDNPASPKPGSGVPQTQLPGANPAPQPSTQPPVPASNNAPAPAQPSPAQPANAQPAGQPTSGDQQKSSSQPQNGAAGKQAEQPATMPPAPPAEPKTEILDSSATSGALATDGHDPILDPAPVPRTTTSLVGGTISVDRMRNRLKVKVFGGNTWTVNFDERTHIFHNGAETTQLALKKGERVYVDTQLDNNRHDIFARNIRVGVAPLPADADGQIVEVDTKHNELTLRDTINSVPVHFAVDQETRISNGQTPAAFKDVKPGTLVHVRFAADRPNRGLAREINILAAPGAAFTFMGKITYLDMHRGLLAIQNAGDDKNYEIHFSPSRTEAAQRLVVGADVRVVATFAGSEYRAQSVNITKSVDALEKEK